MSIYHAVFENRAGMPFHGHIRHASTNSAYLISEHVPNVNDEGQLRIQVPANQHSTAIEVVSAECRVGTLILSGDKLQAELHVLKWSANHPLLFEHMRPKT